MSDISVVRFDQPAVYYSVGTSPIEDYRNRVSFLLSRQIVEDCLIRRNEETAASLQGNGERAVRVRLYTQLALEYWDQASRSARSPASFVSTYYCGLNLMKACIALGPCYSELDQGDHKRHGLSRQQPIVTSDFSDEHVAYYNSGAFALLYRTMTGEPLQAGSVAIRRLIQELSIIGSEADFCQFQTTPTLCFRFSIGKDKSSGQRTLYARYEKASMQPANSRPEPSEIALFKDG